MDRDDSTRAGRQYVRKLLPVHGIRFCININKDWCCSNLCDCFNGSNKRIGYSNDFIARSNLACAQSQGQGIRPRSQPYAMGTAAICREVLLEGMGLWTK